jgi:alpha-D-xyloside xylohydrolase
MLGPALLVAPVFEPGGRVRFYLPKGRWHDFWSQEVLEGPCWREETMPLDRLPVYVRDDTMLPFAPAATYVGERAWDPLEVAVRVSGEASLRVQGEGVDVAIGARREADGLALDLEGKASLRLRLLAPDVHKADVTGDAADVRQEREDGSLTLSLRLDGRSRIELR